MGNEVETGDLETGVTSKIADLEDMLKVSQQEVVQLQSQLKYHSEEKSEDLNESILSKLEDYKVMKDRLVESEENVSKLNREIKEIQNNQEVLEVKLVEAESYKGR